MEVFSPEDARKYAEYMYDPAFKPEPYQVEWVHTALAAAAGFTALRSYNDHLAAQGNGNLEQPDPATMKDRLASYASSEVDKIVVMKGLTFIDAQRVKTHAAEEALYLANQQHGSTNSGRQPGAAPVGGEAASYYSAGNSSHQVQAPVHAPPSGPPPGYQAHTLSSTGFAQAPQLGYTSGSGPVYGDHKSSAAPQILPSTLPIPGPSTIHSNHINPNLSDRERRKLEKEQRKAQRKAEKERMKGMSKEAKKTYKDQRRAARSDRREERSARRKSGRRSGSSSSSSSGSSDSD